LFTKQNLVAVCHNQVEYIRVLKIGGAGAPLLEIRVVSDPLETRVSPACVTMPNLVVLTIYRYIWPQTVSPQKFWGHWSPVRWSF